jgi:hypothetical protein
MDAASHELRDFFDYLWGEDKPFEGKPTYVYLPVQHAPYGPKDWETFMFSWPRHREAVIGHTLARAAAGDNVFFSPALYKAGNAEKKNVLGSHVLWVDFDGNAPEEWPVVTAEHLVIPSPTLVVQSSLPQNQHCYWKLTEFVSDVEELEDRNRAIAYALGADTSGWDADQILRPIHTVNRKRNLPVHVVRWER